MVFSRMGFHVTVCVYFCGCDGSWCLTDVMIASWCITLFIDMLQMVMMHWYIIVHWWKAEDWLNYCHTNSPPQCDLWSTVCTQHNFLVFHIMHIYSIFISLLIFCRWLSFNFSKYLLPSAFSLCSFMRWYFSIWIFSSQVLLSHYNNSIQYAPLVASFT